eukprot:gene5619-8569_t
MARNASLTPDEMIEAHAVHWERSKGYLPRVYGGDPELAELDLSASEMTDVSLVSLCDALRGNTAVTALDLSKNYIETDGCHGLASLLETNPPIRRVDLTQNHLTDEGCNSLLQALDANDTLTELLVSPSPLLSKRAAENLAVAVALNSRPAALKAAISAVRMGAVQLLDLSFGGDDFRDLEHQPARKLDCWAAKRVAEVLAKCRSVTELRLRSQQVGDEGAVALAEMLRLNDRIDVLDLFDNAVTDVGAGALAACIDDNNTVTVINVKANCVSQTGVFALERRLLENRQPLFLKKCLRKLADDDPTMVALSLDEHESCRYYDDLSASMLAECLGGNTHLTSLDLSNNAFTDVGVHVLADMLGKNEGIRTLNLSHNRIGGLGAKHLAEALRGNRSVASLVLKDCGLDDRGGEELADAVAQNDSITHLDLSDNWAIKESGATFVRAVQCNCNLKSLDLANTGVSRMTLRTLADSRAIATEPEALRTVVAKLHRGDVGYSTVCLSGRQGEFALSDGSASILSSILRDSYVLTDLDLSNNEITKKGVHLLCEGLTVNRYTLKRLNLSKNVALDYEVARMLCGVLSQHRALSALDLSSNRLLDSGGMVLYDYLKNEENATILRELHVADNRMEPSLERNITALVESHKCLPALKGKLIAFLERRSRLEDDALTIDRLHDAIDPDTPRAVLDHAAAVIALAVDTAPDVKKISFRGNRLGDPGVASLVELFGKNKNLTSLDLSDNHVTDTGVRYIIDLVRAHPHITRVALHGNLYITEEGLNSLQYTLRFNAQSDKLKLLLLQILRNDPSFTTIDCSGFTSGAQVTDFQLAYICEALAKNDYVQTMNLGHNHISLSGVVQLIDTLRTRGNVVSLSLRNNILDGSNVGRAFAEFLAGPYSAELASLDLSHNDVNEAGVRALLEALEHNDTLIELNLSGSCVSDELLDEASRCVKLNRELEVKRLLPRVKEDDPTIVAINLSNRKTSDVTVFSTCAALRTNSHVTHLDLSRNRHVTDASSVNHLSVLLRENVTPLRYLSLAHTSTTTVGAAAVIAALVDNSTLQSLDLTGTSLHPGKPVVDAAESAFEVNTCFLSLILDDTGLTTAEVNRINGKNLNAQPLLRVSLPRLHVDDATLTVLDFSTSGAHDNTTCFLLSEALLFNTALQSLDLSDAAKITDTGVGYLAHMLHQNRALTSLGLRSCSVSDVGAGDLAVALRVNKTLTALDLSNTSVGNPGCRKLVDLLRSDVYGNDALKDLRLAHSSNIREDTMADLSVQLALNNGPIGLKYDLPKIAANA